jgi:KaiC/GvpD/RAD55 family RecA-like ATPase
MLHGGFLEGRVILLSGPSGTGKSTFAMQYAYKGAVELGEPALYVTLEEPKNKIIDNMAQLGMDLKKAEEKGKFFIIGGAIADLKLGMFKSNASYKHLIDEICEVIREKGIKRVVIDSINLFLMLTHSEEESRLALAELCNRLSKLGCTTIMTSEVKEGTMELSRHGIEEFVVDGVIILYLVRKHSTFVPGIAVRKMRGTSHDKEIRFFKITEKGVEVYPEETMFSDI